MKKEFRLTHNNGKYEFMKTGKSGTSFTIESASLKFDIKDYYRVFFEDVSEKIEIDIVNDISAKDGAEIGKVGHHIFITIKEVTDKICAKLNEEYFTKT
jgi:hypothetical protein